MSSGSGMPKMPAAGESVGAQGILHQRGKLAMCPMKMAIGGFAFVLTIGYFTLYSNKKPEATALDVAKVTTGVATSQNTHPRN